MTQNISFCALMWLKRAFDPSVEFLMTQNISFCALMWLKRASKVKQNLLNKPQKIKMYLQEKFLIVVSAVIFIKVNYHKLEKNWKSYFIKFRLIK